MTIIVTAIVLAFVAEQVVPYRYAAQALTARLLPPVFAGGQGSHVLGTDVLGRDVLSRLVVGLRASLAAGFGGVAVGCALGTVVGLLAGYLRGWVENVLMTIVDVKLAIPGILLAIGVIAVLGSSGVVLVVVIGLGLWTGFARVVRSLVVRLRNEEFVEAARSIGADEPRIIFRHILPNCATPIIVLATLDMPTAVVLEASLSFLGIGIQPPIPSLGNMIADGRGYLDVNPWLSVIPAIVLIIVTLSVTRVGDWISLVLDPSSTQGSIA
jgi:peptide/nickel transport system permease protein